MYPVITKLCLEALRQFLDIRVDHSRLSGFLHFLHGNPFPAVYQVFIYGPLEQPGILQNHGKGSPQAVPCNPVNILPVQVDAPFVNIVETHQQVDHRSFPRPCRPYYGNLLPRAGMKIKV